MIVVLQKEDCAFPVPVGTKAEVDDDSDFDGSFILKVETPNPKLRVARYTEKLLWLFWRIEDSHDNALVS